MLTRLYIKDFALIDEVEISISPGFSVITGQTGAGKSILLGALNMVLGERADTDLVRAGAQKAVAEAEFDLANPEEFYVQFSDAELEEANPIILRREIKGNGSRAFINDAPVPVTVLKSVGDVLVDLHGQHDHQTLLREDFHRVLVDGFDLVAPHMGAYSVAYSTYNYVRKQRRELIKKQSELTKMLEVYRLQKKELDDAKLVDDEEDELRAEMKRLDSVEDLNRQASLILELGQEGEHNILDMLRRIRLAIDEMAELDDEFSTYKQETETALISLGEMLAFTEQYRGNIEHNPRRLDQIRTRLNDLKVLQRKYTKTIPELISHLAFIEEQLQNADRYENQLADLEIQEQEKKEALLNAGFRLTDARRKMGDVLETEIVQQLSKLGIGNAKFELRMVESADEKSEITNRSGKKIAWSEFGFEELSFWISTNKGEPVKPLSKTASGGEISRIMLALKATLAKEHALPVMIFDEIDTGISGSISDKVGETMKELAERCQILAITHQAQIASKAAHHYVVEKHEKDGRTISHIREISRNERISELAGMMSGETISDEALHAAEKMLGEC